MLSTNNIKIESVIDKYSTDHRIIVSVKIYVINYIKISNVTTSYFY